jgi:hypothetical protein
VEGGKWDPKLSGCYGRSILTKYLSYIDYNNAQIVPVAHATLLGAIKDLWALLLCKTPKGQKTPWYSLPKAHRRVMAARAASIVLTNDHGRPYHCVVNQRGYWVMENWINWTEVFSVFILLPIQKVRNMSFIAETTYRSMSTT